MMTTNNRKWNLAGLIATVVIALSIPLSWFLNRTQAEELNTKAFFTGGKSCIECHQKEFSLWKGSDHYNAMSVATDSSVLGNFKNVLFNSNGKTSKFYKRDARFFVFTEGPEGVPKEFEITHTFGVRPLQQYLIPFENGKYQCLPIAWNTLKKEWFDMAAMIYTPEDLRPDNWLHWTNQAQNWNSMCAECHSTNLQKNYNLQTKSYNTTWSDINVNCEACHGPGSKHIDWARLPEMSRPQDINTGLLIKTSKLTSRQYVESCAPCHARRSSLGTNNHEDSDFISYAVPQLLNEPIYYIDGQFRDEDYEYASFTQSKMYMKEVRCGDCHDPHSLKQKFEGNGVCTQCHRADEYDSYNHHLHKSKGEIGTAFYNKRGEKMEVGSGALCRDCHLPGKFYMGVDKRFDHSIRIPRPDLSIKLGTPNACTNCHDDKTNEWALQNVNKWYGETKKAHYATLLADGAAGKSGAEDGLLKMINSNLYPDIIRATALGYLSAYSGEKAREAIIRSLNDPEPLMRLTAVQNLNATDSVRLFRYLVSMVNDPIKSVRMESANRLSTFSKRNFNEIQFKSYKSALNEYQKSLEFVADFPTGRYNLANYYSKIQNQSKAEENYKEAIVIDNLFFPAKTNLAMIYYQQGKTDLAETVFNDLVKNHPEAPDGYYYLALLYGEQKKFQEAIALLESANKKGIANTRIYYNLGLLYQMDNQNEKSESTLLKGLKGDPANFDLLYALYAFYAQKNDYVNAKIYIDMMRSIFPEDKQVKEMYENFLKK